MEHFYSLESLSEIEIMNLITMSHELRHKTCTFHTPLVAANLFFEPSTRTKNSFLMAEKKLGMETVDFSPETSSMKKGESLYDTVKTFEAIGANALVIRHEADDWLNELEHQINIPIINAGAGKKEHPTQCLLDAATIHHEFEHFKGLKVVIAGDIKHSRVAHSNAALLSRLGAEVYLSGAPSYKDEHMQFPFIPMDEAVEMADVLMLLRIQHERHADQVDQVKDYHEKYGLTLAREKRMKDHAIILHPAPINRGVEIASSLVECKKSRIFEQMTNGVYVRMAVLTKKLLQWGIIHENQINECFTTGGQPITALCRAH